MSAKLSRLALNLRNAQVFSSANDSYKLVSMRTPRQSLRSDGNGVSKLMKPQKLPTLIRGGGLRVGRVVSDVRDSSTWDNQSSSLFVQEEERRVQEELIEMLTVKLAHKEKEIEMLRCKQSVIDNEADVHDRQLRQQEEAHTRVVSDLALTNQELQRQLQLLQIQCEQLQVESEDQHTSALEQRRLREKEQAQAKMESKSHHQMVEDLRRDQEQLLNERYALENNMQRILHDQQTQTCLVEQLESKCSQLESDLQASQEDCRLLREALAREEQQRKDTDTIARKLEEEKVSLEVKQRALQKTLKGASSRVADMEKKRSKLSQAEDQLTGQLAVLKKEIIELKARRGQMSSQTKHLQARIASLENANAVQERKLEDTAVELESAHRCYRECQFRNKQLQEEIVFLKNRKLLVNLPASTDNSLTLPNVQAPTEIPEASTPETDTADDVPCWMKG
ncbi:hypothetical protein P3T76_002613 [Phytophthora citrophthora]|uniref:Uncharacterized protein n=1 Tax=Phytophthora citrophthora TaxID=4793 RepID=A0AAD9GVA2_9STRA|nr:hypothetical protein P3T76_002613 [Phytophthora citrophthora]